MNIKGIAFLAILLIAFDLVVAFTLSPLATTAVMAAIEKNADIELRIESLKVHPLLLSVTAKNVDVFDSENTSQRIFHGTSMNARIDLLGILSKKVYLSSLKFNGVELEVVKDESGQFNFETLSQPASEEDSAWSWKNVKDKFTGGGNDWFSQIWGRIKKRLESNKTKKDVPSKAVSEHKVQTKELAKGRRVDFSSMNQTLFKVGHLELKNGKVTLTDKSLSLPPFENIHIELRGLSVLKSGDMEFKRVHASADFLTKRKGKVVIDLKNSAEVTYAQLELVDVDLGALKPLYEDSLPVSFSSGYISLSSDSTIAADKLRSKNDLTLAEFKLTPRKSLSLASLSMGAIAEAMNTFPTLNLSFSIGGTPGKPSFSGFNESLMTVIKDKMGPSTMDNVKLKASELKDQAGDKLKDLSSKVKSLF